MAEDIFHVRSMVEAVQILKPPSSFFLNTFFRGTPIESPSDTIEIDVEKHKRRLAPFVSPIAAAKAGQRNGYSAYKFTPPYVKPLRESNAANYLKRNPGENPYSGRTIAQRAAGLMAKDLAEMDQEINRTEEWLAAQQLAEGTVTVTGEGVSATIDFQRDSAHNVASTSLTGGAGWNGGSAKPLTDLRTYKRLILKDSGHVADTAVFGLTAWSDFIGNAQVIDYFDKLHIVPGSLQPQGQMIGGQFMGTCEGLELWLYSDWYLDASEAEQPMIPEDYVILGNTMTRAERNYGAIQNDEAIFPARRWPSSWRENNPPIRYVMLESAPLPVAHEPDAFVRLDVRA